MKELSKYYDGCLKILMRFSSFYKWNVVFLIFCEGAIVLIEVTTSSKF